ncbi:hypothetical protein ON058_02220 [Demequina sp. B12]|uniref:dienelactone hydrolase family protein n=1 Tax=Demequina sp. B12 TaxID=2992757 RepID=UPI00237A8399|nr:hypothetical protein [Demequina sp. B12]MDE0572227.1 hypothetical protein [Demequina sp. B12]
MATVILLHSALGKTRHVQDWADILTQDDHDVRAPDLYGGVTFTDLDQGVAHADSLGGPLALAERARAAAADVEEPLVYAGFSLGAAVAQACALADERAVGLVMMHGGLNPAWLNVEVWPARLAAQLHWSDREPWAEPEENAALMALAGEACEEFRYEATGHLFGFQGWPDYDSEESHRMYERVADFMGACDI